MKFYRATVFLQTASAATVIVTAVVLIRITSLVPYPTKLAHGTIQPKTKYTARSKHEKYRHTANACTFGNLLLHPLMAGQLDTSQESMFSIKQNSPHRQQDILSLLEILHFGVELEAFATHGIFRHGLNPVHGHQKKKIKSYFFITN